MTSMHANVVLKTTSKKTNFLPIAFRMFDRASDLTLTGAIANGNCAELATSFAGRIYHFGSKSDLNFLRMGRNRSRIFDFGDLDPSGKILVDTDSDTGLVGGFDRRIIQSWAIEDAIKYICADKSQKRDLLQVEKSSVISSYLVLSALRDLFYRAHVNIVRSGDSPQSGSKEKLEIALKDALGSSNHSFQVTQYVSGFRFYDIVLTLFGSSPFSDKDVIERLRVVPRIRVEIGPVGSHDILKIIRESTALKKERPPIVVCLVGDPKSQVREIRLITDPLVNIASANLDATRILNGMDPFSSMRMTDEQLNLASSSF